MNRLMLTATLLLWVTSIHAELVTWVIHARVTDIRTDMIGYANIGDIVTLKYKFESTTPDSEPETVERGKYDDAVKSAEIFLNGDHAQLENVGYITILNDWQSHEDVYLTDTIETATISETLPTYNQFGFVGYSFTYKDDDATMFNNTNLTVDPITDGYDTLRITLKFRNPPAGPTGQGSAIIAEDLISISRDLIFKDSFE